MPRKNRILSSSRIYHVVSRGIDKKPIFISTDDYNQFINILRKKRKFKLFTIYAYCLMNNHYHLIVNEKEAGISSIMSSINTTYAIYFNKKYNRIGHLFQSRFRSEAIEDEAYFLAAVRYVHNNPVSAGLVSEASQYNWSSYRSYLQLDSNDDLIDYQFALNMFASSLTKAVPRFVQFTKQIDEQDFVDHLGEKEEMIAKEKKAKSLIDKYLQEKNMNIEKLKLRSNMGIRNELIGMLIEKTDLPLRRIGKLLDLSKSTVSRFK
ncbi:MAG: transposase [Dethiobacteria bacterium]|nr:transposase [Bacillota bacterium]HOA35956.1 transposase [Bacillota bacterium]HOJ83366.1 transposase [Bacillota bacterium]HOL15187.1 transposase [Bacillota bacterium]HQE10325.1 transposase [Bacillota bacterium]